MILYVFVCPFVGSMANVGLQLLVDKKTGATTVLRNDFANNKFAFTDIGVVTGTATCTEGYGYELHDVGVHWNDLDGDGMYSNEDSVESFEFLSSLLHLLTCYRTSGFPLW